MKKHFLQNLSLLILNFYYTIFFVFFSLLQGYLFIVLVIVFQKVIKHHQELYRFQHNLHNPPQGVLFPDVQRKTADENITGFFKYLCNHFFANFGVEVNMYLLLLISSKLAQNFAAKFSKPRQSASFEAESFSAK